ncbi:hypothetical protein D3C72_1883650 [compost metagenome]
MQIADGTLDVLQQRLAGRGVQGQIAARGSLANRAAQRLFHIGRQQVSRKDILARGMLVTDVPL